MKPTKTYRAIRLARVVTPLGRTSVPPDRAANYGATPASSGDAVRLRIPIARIQEALQRKDAATVGSAQKKAPLASSVHEMIHFHIPMARIQEALEGKNASASSAVKEALQSNKPSGESPVERATRTRPVDFRIPLARTVLPIDLKPQGGPRSGASKRP